ncbi:MFS transporter [Jatrophihabitans endophyticus]|uniref:MFS transporter n=1 Tax=Jatrophihabitans endophyticus TaxID=1206085 RepID=UPI0019EEEAD2|nr:MFS transporter [Jatrophihabitans endophyticus]MBE7190029.1 MFS transporter [Jatrophihabitans endophyticus]
MTEDEPDPRRWAALFVCVTALFMTLLDVSIVLVALPSIGHGIGAGASELQWVVSGYALSFGMVPIIAGRLGDDRGRRAMLLTGIAFFVLFSATVGLAPTPGVLIAGRVLQGLAGGLINPQVSGLVQQLFPQHERGRAFGTIGTTVGVATASGPVIGGGIIALGGDSIGWRLCFLVNVPVGIASFLLCRRLLPKDQPRDHKRALDLPGAGLLALGMFGVLFPIVEYDSDRDFTQLVIVAPALAVLVGFVLWERGPARRRGHPLMDLALFKLRSYSSGVALAFVYFVGYTGTPLVLSLFLQYGLGFSPLHSGLTAVAYAVGTAVSAPIGGRLVPRIGRKLLVGALLLFVAGVAGAAVVGLLATGHLANDDIAFALAGPLLVAGLGGGSVITPNQALSLSEVDVAGGSTAGGTLQTAQRVGNATGSALGSAVFYGVAASAAGLSGAARASHYGHAYASALGLAVLFGLGALALAVHDARGAAPRTASA